MNTRFAASLLLAGLPFALGCSGDESQGAEAAEELESAADDASEALDEAGKEIEDGVDEAADAAEKAMDDGHGHDH